AALLTGVDGSPGARLLREIIALAATRAPDPLVRALPSVTWWPDGPSPVSAAEPCGCRACPLCQQSCWVLVGVGWGVIGGLVGWWRCGGKGGRDGGQLGVDCLQRGGRVDVGAGSGEPGAVGVDRVQLVFLGAVVQSRANGEESAAGCRGRGLEVFAERPARCGGLVVEVLPEEIAAGVGLCQPGHD